MNLRKGAWRLPSCAAHSNAILFNTCQRRRRRVMSFYFGYATKRQPAQPDGPQAHQANPFLGLRKHHPIPNCSRLPKSHAFDGTVLESREVIRILGMTRDCASRRI